ncbi:hypothetical protein WMO40_16450 [Bacillaceae bacterium CLA-AA-H227]|uniref:Uncharacterized protein n=1 Tax=Robertmurraya yapensis (ex Hitch et al 2024) TaxID=3133160 RepID=A0ACC6SEN6_9BACI
MKREFNLVFLSALLLVGCSDDNNLAEARVVEAESTFSTEYSPNPQVPDDRSLMEIGQTVSDKKGEATLEAISEIGDTFEFGPIRLTIKEMKQIHLRPDYSLIDYFHVLTHEEEFDFVKVFVQVENTSTEPVHFAPVAKMKTNLGEEFDSHEDIYLEELNGELLGKEVKQGNIGFIVHTPGTLEWILLNTSDIFNKSEMKIFNSQEIKLTF